jgi:hypothetical protein
MLEYLIRPLLILKAILVIMTNQNSDNKDEDSGAENQSALWRTRIFIVPMIAIIIGIATFAPHFEPSWFATKTVGTGFTPATWQGWLITVGPPIIILVVVGVINFKQRQK